MLTVYRGIFFKNLYFSKATFGPTYKVGEPFDEILKLYFGNLFQKNNDSKDKQKMLLQL